MIERERKGRLGGSIAQAEVSPSKEARQAMGCAARPGSESRADACVDSPGTREIPKSPPENNRIGAKPVKQSPWSVLVSGHRRAKTDRAGSIAERAASEAPEMEQGSLSALIVPMESWETVAGSQGVGKGGAEMGLLFLPYSSPFLSVSPGTPGFKILPSPRLPVSLSPISKSLLNSRSVVFSNPLGTPSSTNPRFPSHRISRIDKARDEARDKGLLSSRIPHRASPRLRISASPPPPSPHLRVSAPRYSTIAHDSGAAHVPGVEGDFGNVADGVVDNADGRDITHDPDVVELVTPEQFAP